MTGFVVLGTDTDAGKTAFCAQWLAAFADRFAYWKPVETGESDTETIRRLVPATTVFAALDLPAILVAPSAVGAVGRTLQAVAGMNDYGRRPAAVVLLGPPDAFAA